MQFQLEFLENYINNHSALAAIQEISWIDTMIADKVEIGKLKGNLTYEEERINELIARKERMITKRDRHKRDLDDHELLLQDCQEMLVQI